MKRFPDATSIDGEAREATIGLLYRLADDDMTLGHRHTEWTGLAPILEADIAFSSIAQDQIGQARAFYTLLHELGEPDPDALVFARKPEDFRCCALCTLEKGNWAFSTMRQFLYDMAKQLRLQHLAESNYEPLAKLVRKLRGEQKYHVMHGHMWISRLGDATSESHAYMQEALDAQYGYALGMFESNELTAKAAKHGISPAEEQLCDEWKGQVHEALELAGLNIPQNATAKSGGRIGSHEPVFTTLLADMRSVYELDPAATW